MPDVLVATSRGHMHCYLAVPSKEAPFPGVIVLHDVGGMSQDHRNQADWLAQAGFLALAVDLYYWGGIGKGRGAVGGIGFCMGGGVALMLVSGRGFSAASINYGGKLPANVDYFLNAACPV